MHPDRLKSARPVDRRPALSTCRAGHVHALPGLTRRSFLQGAAGATALGVVVGSGALRPQRVEAAGPGIGLAEPIPSTIEIFPGVESHVLAPPFLFGPDSDASTVYNFEGAVGIAFISGMVERRNRRTKQTETLPYIFNDMRFMQGQFQGRDGHVRGATFALI